MMCFWALPFIERKATAQNTDGELYEKLSANALAMSCWVVTFMWQTGGDSVTWLFPSDFADSIQMDFESVWEFNSET